ncbi:MAG: SAM-dependent methyltransferase [Bacteroidetes bacterium]|nr:SAM-dependent methyltransferase [Bacteroidota bacterium]
MPTLHLIPSPISKLIELPAFVEELRWIIVENLREARRFLRANFSSFPIDECHFLEINKNTLNLNDISRFLKKAQEKNQDIGLLSDAGVPCVADPGSEVVRIAHQLGFKVHPLIGPSSILLALMASGFNGQQFAFHGYLPIPENEQINRIMHLEAESSKRTMTQIFIETPYRNNALLERLLKTLNPSTRLCVAADIQSATEEIVSKTVRDWQHVKYNFHKRPAVFLLYAG